MEPGSATDRPEWLRHGRQQRPLLLGVLGLVMLVRARGGNPPNERGWVPQVGLGGAQRWPRDRDCSLPASSMRLWMLLEARARRGQSANRLADGSGDDGEGDDEESSTVDGCPCDEDDEESSAVVTPGENHGALPSPVRNGGMDCGVQLACAETFARSLTNGRAVGAVQLFLRGGYTAKKSRKSKSKRRPLAMKYKIEKRVRRVWTCLDLRRCGAAWRAVLARILTVLSFFRSLARVLTCSLPTPLVPCLRYEHIIRHSARRPVKKRNGEKRGEKASIQSQPNKTLES